MGRPLPAGLSRESRVIALAALLALAMIAVTAAPAAARSAHRGTVPATRGAAFRARHQFSPEVIRTGTAPTGYEVTFRYYDPSATTVQVRGEWFFSNAADTTTTSSAGLLPSQWAPGDFPIAFPNQGPAPNWPVAQMTLDSSTGVWSYTTPLPSGTFTYGFYVNCTSPPPGLTGCTELSDPRIHRGIRAARSNPTARSTCPRTRDSEPRTCRGRHRTAVSTGRCPTCPMRTRSRRARSAATRWRSIFRPDTTRTDAPRIRRST